MNTGSKLRRTEDGKEYTVIVLSHWSEIRAEDGTTDKVKWYGGDNWVGYNSGYTYTLL